MKLYVVTVANSSASQVKLYADTLVAAAIQLAQFSYDVTALEVVQKHTDASLIPFSHQREVIPNQLPRPTTP